MPLLANRLSSFTQIVKTFFMFNISYLDVSGSMGLIASGALTLNIIVGILLSTGFKKTSYWKKLPYQLQQYPLIQFHQLTAYAGLLFTALHILFLIAYKEENFTFYHLLKPLKAPKQANIVLFGAIGFYGLILTIITSQKIIKRKLSFRTWKNIHLIAYVTGLFFLLHGLLMDPLLKDRPTDWLDAEKFFSEACLGIVLIAILLRIRYQFKSTNN